MTRRSFAGSAPAPEFPSGLDWLNTDRPLSMAQLRGKVVVLDFWTYGCINCMHIIPDLKLLEAEFPEELVVIGVHSAKFKHEGATDNIRQVILRYGLEHPVINDRDFHVWQTWGARAWPTLAIIDPAGNVVGAHSGEGIFPLFKTIVASLIEEFDAQHMLDRTPLNLKLEKAGLPETVLSFPGKVRADAAHGRLFIADSNHHRIVVAASDSGDVLHVIGCGERGLRDGSFRRACFAQPQGMALSADGQTLYVADTENHALRRVDLLRETVTTLAGTGSQASDYPPKGGKAPHVELSSPWDLALNGQQLFIAMAGSHQIWGMDLPSNMMGPVVGSGREGTEDGPLLRAELAQPSGLALDGMGRLYFADSEGSSIRWAEIVPRRGRVGTLVGSGVSLFDFGDVDGIGREARLQHPLGVAVKNSTVYVADTYNSKIKRIEPATRQISTFVGKEAGWRDGTEPLFYEPGGIDIAGDTLYVADTNNHAIRLVSLQSGQTTTLVLKGIEHIQSVAANASGATFGGKAIHFAPITVGAGYGKLLVNLALPAGYKLNEQATHSMAWQVQGTAVRLPAEASNTLEVPTLPITLDLVLTPGESTLFGDFALFYCAETREGICFVERVRLVQPLCVDTSSTHIATIYHRITAPELASVAAR
jgi:DNA-binding beta-propeller fold protein YncE